MVALLIMSYRCIVTINVLWLFLAVPWVGLQWLSVVFPDHTHFFKVTFVRSYHIVESVYVVTVVLYQFIKEWLQEC